MSIKFRSIVIVVAVLASAPLAAQTRPTPAERSAAQAQQVEHAKERCRQNRGVDCDTPEGLKEWLLQERSREEAVREGSRHLLPAQRGQTAPRR
jgi:hypothetical protein